MAFLVKSIKPAKMNLKGLRADLFSALDAEGKIHVKEYKKTVRTWKHKVGFGYDIDHKGPDVAVISGPTTGAVENWVRLNEGVKPRAIYPRKAKALQFRPKFKSKTRPYWIGSRRGGSSGDYVFAKRVKRWPGIQAREWDRELRSKRKKPFERMITAKVRIATNRLYP